MNAITLYRKIPIIPSQSAHSLLLALLACLLINLLSNGLHKSQVHDYSADCTFCQILEDNSKPATRYHSSTDTPHNTHDGIGKTTAIYSRFIRHAGNRSPPSSH